QEERPEDRSGPAAPTPTPIIPSRAPEMSAPMVPVGMVAECVAIKSGLTEIVQTFEILRCELVVGELVMAKLIVAELIVAELIVAKLIVGGKRVATSVFQIVTGSPPSISSHCVAVTENMRSGLMTAAAHGVTANSV